MKKRNQFWILSPFIILWFGLIVSLGIRITKNINIESGYLVVLNYLYFVYLFLCFVSIFLMSKDYLKNPYKLKIINYLIFMIIACISAFPQNFFLIMFFAYSLFQFWQTIILLVLILVFVYNEFKLFKLNFKSDSDI